MGFFKDLAKGLLGLPEDLHCKECRELLKGCAYEYQVKRQSTRSDGTLQVTYVVRATCQKCGKVNIFTHFITARNGVNPDAKMRDWLVGTFGH